MIGSYTCYTNFGTLYLIWDPIFSSFILYISRLLQHVEDYCENNSIAKDSKNFTIVGNVTYILGLGKDSQCNSSILLYLLEISFPRFTIFGDLLSKWTSMKRRSIIANHTLMLQVMHIRYAGQRVSIASCTYSFASSLSWIMGYMTMYSTCK